MREQTQQPAIAEAVAEVASAAQRLVEERFALLRLELRNDARRMLRASALGVGGLTAVAAAVALAAAALVTTLMLWMPVGPALGITAGISAVVGVGLTLAARRRLPRREVEAKGELGGAASEPSRAMVGREAEPERALHEPESGRALSEARRASLGASSTSGERQWTLPRAPPKQAPSGEHA